MVEFGPGITRQKLYEMVWKEPVEDVALRFGLSGRGLAKFCERHSIPVPPRGYWQLKAAGRAPKVKPPLLALPSERFEQLDIRLRTATANSDRQHRDGQTSEAEELHQAYLAELETGRSIVVPERLRKPHPIVSKWLRGHHMAFPLLADVDPLTARRLCILDVLLKTFIAFGFDLDPLNQTENRLVLEHRSTRIEIGLGEHIRQYRRPLTAEEKAAPFETRKFRQVHEPTGALKLTVALIFPRGSLEGLQTEWRDEPGKAIETALAEVAACVIIVAGTGDRLRAQLAREEDARRQREQQQEDRRREREAEAQRREVLKTTARAWRQAMDIRDFVDAVRSAQAKGVNVLLPRPTDEWIAWASTVADELDPVLRQP